MIIIKIINLINGLNFYLNIDKRMKEVKFMSLISSILEGFGSIFAGASSTACALVWFDEPKCPKSLIK